LGRGGGGGRTGELGLQVGPRRTLALFVERGGSSRRKVKGLGEGRSKGLSFRKNGSVGREERKAKGKGEEEGLLIPFKALGESEGRIRGKIQMLGSGGEVK